MNIVKIGNHFVNLSLVTSATVSQAGARPELLRLYFIAPYDGNTPINRAHNQFAEFYGEEATALYAYLCRTCDAILMGD